MAHRNRNMQKVVNAANSNKDVLGNGNGNGKGNEETEEVPYNAPVVSLEKSIEIKQGKNN